MVEENEHVDRWTEDHDEPIISFYFHLCKYEKTPKNQNHTDYILDTLDTMIHVDYTLIAFWPKKHRKPQNHDQIVSKADMKVYESYGYLYLR